MGTEGYPPYDLLVLGGEIMELVFGFGPELSGGSRVLGVFWIRFVPDSHHGARGRGTLG